MTTVSNIGGTSNRKFLVGKSGLNFESGVDGQSATININSTVVGNVDTSGVGTKVGIVNKTSAYTVVASDLGKIINCTSGTFTVSLTAAATLGAGFNCWIWNTSPQWASTITIDPNLSEMIDGAPTLTLRRGEGVQIICDGTNWQTGNKKSMRGYSENIGFGDISAKPAATGADSVAMGRNAIASGAESFAYGVRGLASGTSAIGLQGSATGNSSTAIKGTASADYSTAIGQNSVSHAAQAVIGAGAMALGGSYASGTDSFAAAVANNTSSYGATGANSIAIGQQAKATGPQSVAITDTAMATSIGSIAIGRQATASGISGFSLVIGGIRNTASGTNACAFGGGGNNASGQFSYASGNYAVAAQYGKQAFASGRFAANGDAQSGKMVLRYQSTSATPVVLRADGFSPGYLYNLDLDQTVAFQILVVARNTGPDTDSKAWLIKGAARRAPASTNPAFIGIPAVETLASDGSAWVAEAWIQNDGITVRGTGEAGKTINWVATIWTTEVTG